MRRRLEHLNSPQTAVAAILSLGLLAMTGRNATDPDLWWHLRTGQWIVETGRVPHADPFSFTRAGHAWVSHEWLSELLFYELWKHVGATGLIIFSAIITSAGFMLLYLRCPGRRQWAALATVIGAISSAPSWGVRPQMFTFALASLLFWLIERGEDRPALLFWIPPLFLLWLNLHAGFALGLALLSAYGIGLVLEIAVGATPWQQARPILFRALLLLIICLALVPLNPSGIQLYRYPLDTLRSAGMRSLIGEWFSPDFHDWLYRPFLLVWLLLLIALASSRSRIKGRVIAPLLLTSFAALDAVRHIPIFVLFAMPVIAGTLPNAPASLDLRRPSHSRLRPVLVGVVLLLMGTLAIVKWISLARNQDVREAKQFPQSAIAFLEAGQYPPRAFVYYDWGGYAIWKLYPKYQVFVDGRADLYGDDLLRQFKTAMLVRTGWKEILDSWNVQTVLLPTSSALAQVLLLEPHWHAVYDDSRAIIILREGAREGVREGLGGDSRNGRGMAQGQPGVEQAAISGRTLPYELRK
jgi:hypothetical protein